MENKKPNDSSSYSEIMKSFYLQKGSQEHFSILEMYIQMFWDEVIVSYKLTLLEEKIDAALDSHDKQLFLELAGQYTNLRLQQKSLIETMKENKII
ncbi:IDEAL domain-containing protein [Neobacillus sp. Marseille-QA0830]